MAVQLMESFCGMERFHFDHPRTKTQHLTKVFG
jgi:hypothetical protein